MSKNFISWDTLLNFRKVTKYKLDTCTGSRVIKNFHWGEGPQGRIGLKLSRHLAFFINLHSSFFAIINLNSIELNLDLLYKALCKWEHSLKFKMEHVWAAAMLAHKAITAIDPTTCRPVGPKTIKDISFAVHDVCRTKGDGEFLLFFILPRPVLAS